LEDHTKEITHRVPQPRTTWTMVEVGLANELEKKL